MGILPAHRPLALELADQCRVAQLSQRGAPGVILGKPGVEVPLALQFQVQAELLVKILLGHAPAQI